MPLNEAEAKAADGAAAPLATPADVAQPAINELTDMAPSGNMGALAKNLSA